MVPVDGAGRWWRFSAAALAVVDAVAVRDTYVPSRCCPRVSTPSIAAAKPATARGAPGAATSFVPLSKAPRTVLTPTLCDEALANLAAISNCLCSEAQGPATLIRLAP